MCRQRPSPCLTPSRSPRFRKPNSTAPTAPTAGVRTPSSHFPPHQLMLELNTSSQGMNKRCPPEPPGLRGHRAPHAPSPLIGVSQGTAPHLGRVWTGTSLVPPGKPVSTRDGAVKRDQPRFGPGCRGDAGRLPRGPGDISWCHLPLPGATSTAPRLERILRGSGTSGDPWDTAEDAAEPVAGRAQVHAGPFARRELSPPRSTLRQP